MRAKICGFNSRPDLATLQDLLGKEVFFPIGNYPDPINLVIEVVGGNPSDFQTLREFFKGFTLEEVPGRTIVRGFDLSDFVGFRV